MFGRCPHWTEDTDSGEMPAPRDPEKPIHLSPHPPPSPGAVLLLPQAPRSSHHFPSIPCPGRGGENRNPGHTASSKVETSEICRSRKKYIENTFRRCELCVPVIWVHRHMLANMALEFSEKQLITGQGFLPLRGLW